MVQYWDHFMCLAKEDGWTSKQCGHLIEKQERSCGESKKDDETRKSGFAMEKESLCEGCGAPARMLEKNSSDDEEGEHSVSSAGPYDVTCVAAQVPPVHASPSALIRETT